MQAFVAASTQAFVAASTIEKIFQSTIPLAGLLRVQGPPFEEGFMLVFAERVL